MFDKVKGRNWSEDSSNKAGIVSPWAPQSFKHVTHQKKVRKRSRDGMKAETSKVNLDDRKDESWECSPHAFPRAGPRSVAFRLANVCLQDMNQPLFKDLQNEDSTSSVPKVNHPLH